MRSAAIVDLPLPEEPTTATIFPGGRVRLKSFNIIYKKTIRTSLAYSIHNQDEILFWISRSSIEYINTHVLCVRSVPKNKLNHR